MLKLKKALCAVLCAVLLGAMAGCSTPKVAMTVDGRDYPTGEYLAYLHNTYQTLYSSSLYYYQYYGQDIWSMTFPYGETEETEKTDTTADSTEETDTSDSEENKLPLAEYIRKMTQDTIVRQKALENLMEKYQITISDEDEKAFEEEMKSVTDSDVIGYGYNKEHYAGMYKAYNYNERTLFYGLYNKGGRRAMSDDAVKEYVQKNYLSYQIISVALTDSDGKELTDEVKAAVKDVLAEYQALYAKNHDFDAVFTAYTAALKKGVTLKNKDGKALATLSLNGTAAQIVLSGAKKPEASKDTTDPTCERQNNAVSAMTDEDLVSAIKEVDEGQAKVVTYLAGGSTATAALIGRYAPLSGKGAVDLTEEHDNVLYYAKYDEFDKEVKEAAAKLDVKLNERAVKMCKPENFDPNYKTAKTTQKSDS